MSTTDHAPGGTRTSLILGAIGVVFGDIGTSPLYTFQECLAAEHGLSATPEHVLGIVSLIVWSLTLVVTVKYLGFLLRADNRGEGGIFALLALVPEKFRQSLRGRVGWVPLLVIAGAALLFGDGIITPAISVLAAIEGLSLVTDKLSGAVVPLTCLILVGLFALQRYGTGKVGRLFGPIMILWFSTIGILGAYHIFESPAVLAALSPHHGARLLATEGFSGFRLLGSVVLAVTGGEALYADMGHFGRGPIRSAWLWLVFPALMLCYLGQGALLLAHPETATQPFFSMVPRGWATLALVALAAPATVIASQALISGVFSLTHQAVRLGYFPRVEVRHTAHDAEGQIYLPSINALLAVSCLLLVVIFQHSSKLAAAFGLAVSGTMAITSVVYYVVLRHTWKWSLWKALPLLVLFLTFDVAFLGANLLKFFAGGYIPLLVGIGFLAVMVVWRRGRALLGEYHGRMAQEPGQFLESLPTGVVRTAGTGVFLASSPHGIPPIVGHLVRRVGSLPAQVVLFSATSEHVPYVTDAERVAIELLPSGFVRVVARYGFLETPSIVQALTLATAVPEMPKLAGQLSYFVGRETFVEGQRGQMGQWEERFFGFLSRNARNASLYFAVPPDQVVEIGMHIDL